VVTLELGVRYLWVDTLCVIQDDLDDWNREAALMADVYSKMPGQNFCNSS